jgi:hypothetical protein
MKKTTCFRWMILSMVFKVSAMEMEKCKEVVIEVGDQVNSLYTVNPFAQEPIIAIPVPKNNLAITVGASSASDSSSDSSIESILQQIEQRDTSTTPQPPYSRSTVSPKRSRSSSSLQSSASNANSAASSISSSTAEYSHSEASSSDQNGNLQASASSSLKRSSGSFSSESGAPTIKTEPKKYQAPLNTIERQTQERERTNNEQFLYYYKYEKYKSAVVGGLASVVVFGGAIGGVGAGLGTIFSGDWQLGLEIGAGIGGGLGLLFSAVVAQEGKKKTEKEFGC